MAEAYRNRKLKSSWLFNRTHRGLRSSRGLSHRRYLQLRRAQKYLGLTIALMGVVLIATASARAEASSPLPPTRTPDTGAREIRVLVVLAAPRDLMTPRGPVGVNPWHRENGAAWYSTVLAPALKRYMERVTYGRVSLQVDITPWMALPETRDAYAVARNLQMWRAVEGASRDRDVTRYDVVVVLDPTSPYDTNYSRDWSHALGWGWFQPGCYQTPARKKRIDCIFTGTFYTGNGYVQSPEDVMVKILAHELSHALDFQAHGRYTLLDNQGEEYSLMGRAYGGFVPLDPVNEELLLGTHGALASAGRPFHLEPRESGPGRFIRIPGAHGDYYAEYRRERVEGLQGYDRPGLLLWKHQGGELDLAAVFDGAGEYTLQPGEVLQVQGLGSDGARAEIVTA